MSCLAEVILHDYMMLLVDQFSVLYDMVVIHEPVIHNELYIFSYAFLKDITSSSLEEQMDFSGR